MRKILIAILFCTILLATGGTALAQGGGAGWFDFVTDVRLHGQVKVLNDLTIDDDATVGDQLIVSGDATIADDLNIADLIGSTYTTITVGYQGTITPTGMYQLLTATAPRGTSSVADPTAGRVVTLVNVGSQTITLTDTGTLKLAGNVALGQYDSVTLLGDGTNWIQVGTSNN